MTAALPALFWLAVVVLGFRVADASRKADRRARTFLPADWQPRGRLYRDAMRHLREVR